MARPQEVSPTNRVAERLDEQPRGSEYANSFVTVAVATGIVAITLGWAALLVKTAVWLVWS